MEAMSAVLGILSFVLQIALVVWVVRFFLRMRKTAGADPFADPDWARRPAFSATDAASQLLLSVGLVLTLAAVAVVNNRAGQPVEQHVPMLVFATLFFAAAYRYRSPITLTVASALAIGWWFVALFEWTSDTGYAVAAPAGLLFFGVALWGAGRVSESFERHERFANVYWVLGMLVIATGLFTLSTQGGLDMLTNLETATLSDWRIAVSTLLLALLAVSALVASRIRKTASIGEVVWLGLVVMAMTTSALIPLKAADVSKGGFETTPVLSAAGVTWATAFNLLLLAGLIGLAFLGYQRREDRLITLSAILLFLFVAIKYFDWLFALLDRSVAFIGSGVLLLGAGLAMERGRRFALKAMEADSDE